MHTAYRTISIRNIPKMFREIRFCSGIGLLLAETCQVNIPRYNLTYVFTNTFSFVFFFLISFFSCDTCSHPGDNPFYSNIDSMPDIRPRRKSIPLVSDLVSSAPTTNLITKQSTIFGRRRLLDKRATRHPTLVFTPIPDVSNN